MNLRMRTTFKMLYQKKPKQGGCQSDNEKVMKRRAKI